MLRMLLDDLHADAAIVAATRIGGIVFGVICSVALSVVVFPKVGAAPQPLLHSGITHAGNAVNAELLHH